jgi:exosortase
LKDKLDNTTLARNGKWHQDGKWRFMLFNIAFVLVFFGPLWDLLRTSWQSEYITYIPFIPFISAYLIYENRRKIFSQQGVAPVPGLIIAGVGALILFAGSYGKDLLDHNDHLAVITCSMIVFWSGGFTLIYGVRSLRAASFPLLFLLFAVPIPTVLLEKAITFLQIGSAELSYWFLKLSGMPIARDGFVFYLPTMDIEVAPECSGIRSSLSLVITGVLAAYFFLRTGWARAILMLSIVPIAIIKNGVRIATLSWLGVYVDQRILASDLHRRGGYLFFVLALALTGGVIVMLRLIEKRKRPADKPSD